MKMTTSKKKRFAAKLLFQFRVMIDGDPGKMRLCEERIINCFAINAREALRIAKRKGKRGSTVTKITMVTKFILIS